MDKVELYLESELQKAVSRQKHTRFLMAVIGAAGLLGCILLCVFTTRKNQSLMLPLTIGLSILTGWTVITLSIFAYGKAKAMSRHVQKIAEGERKAFAGRIEKTDEVWHIRKGVTVRKVRFSSEEREMMLNVSEALSKRLPDAFSGKVDVVYGFIVAYEVEDHA